MIFFDFSPFHATHFKTRILSPLFIFLILMLGLSHPATAGESSLALSLEQAIDMALSRNRNILRARNSLDTAQISLHSANADFDIQARPFAGGGVTDGDENFNSGVTLSKSLKQGVEVSLSPYLSKNSDTYGSAVGLSLEIPLLKYYGELVNTQAIQSSEFSLRQSRRSLIQTQENIVLETVTAFYNIIEQEKTVGMNRLLAERFKQHTALAQIKTDIGLAQPLDVYRAQIKEKDAQVSLSNAMEKLQSDYNSLKSILAIAQDRIIEITDAPVESAMPAPDIDSLEAIAFENSVEFKSALDQLNDKKRQAKIAEHYLLPDLSLSVDYTRTGDADSLRDEMFRLDDDTWRVYLTSSTDFKRTSEKNSYRQSLLAVQSSELDLATRKDQVSKDIKNQVDFLEKTRQRIALLADQIQKAEGKLELSAIKFNNGMAGNFDMIEAETEVHQARLSHLSAEIDYTIGTYRLRKIIGTLIASN